MDMISRQAAIQAAFEYRVDEIENDYDKGYNAAVHDICKMLKKLPSAQPDSCKGCKHMGLWENEVEYGYTSPCTRCKRKASDNYER